MHPPPLFVRRSQGAQIVLGIVVPAVFGLITGIMLGVSEPVYLVLSLLGVLGGLGAGYEHAGGAEGAGRGVAGGMLFGTFILFGHAVSGLDEKAHLPEPHILLPVITTILGVLLGALGGALRARRERRAPTAPAGGITRGESPSA
jgi:hypothetical protein